MDLRIHFSKRLPLPVLAVMTVLAVCGGSVADPLPKEPIRFVDVTKESGINWEHNTGAFGAKWLPETIGPGVVVLDANVDGRPDLLFVNGRNFPGKPEKATIPALYLNQGGFRFTEATREAGLAFSAYCLGGVAGDIDNDGDPDLYLSCLGQDFLLRNDKGRFTDISRQAGLAQDFEFGASAAFFDADNDGFLDIFVTRYVRWTPETDVFCSYDGKTKAYCTPVLYKGISPRYYHNRGNGSFEDWTQKAGFEQPSSKLLGVVPLDADNDGWTDLAVAADANPNLLFRNKGNGTFEEVGLVSGIAYSPDGRVRGGMGIAIGDYNRSGRLSLAITYFSNELTGFYRNEGNVFFLDIGPVSEIGRATRLTLGWGCFFFDYDLDGWLDFFLANGHLDDQVSKILPNITYAQPQQLFRNNHKGDFSEVTDTDGGDLARPIVARGAAFADFDDDGDLDIALTTNGGQAKIFENRGSGHGNWLRLSLEGTSSNRDGLGALVKVTLRDGSQIWFVHSGGTYLSQSQIDPTFGLGSASVVDEVLIRWPSGVTQRLQNVKANQRLSVREPKRSAPLDDGKAKRSP
ncbi:MAG TPA: CRTAC1 family protein [Thermoanaerobaculia bacterium]|nr:CRTAC1 family protein [Thermoanaerobaculia bacterium]